MKKQRNILRGIAKDNRGSGMVIVLVSMLCVALMGASLLFMSYTGLQIKVTERQAGRDFYSAEAAMDEIRAGLQAQVSDAIATSYKYVLETYSSSEGIAERFKEKFLDDLKKAELFTSSGGRVYYDADALKEFVRDKTAVTVAAVTATGGSSAAGRVEETDNGLALEGVRVTYEASNGYTTDVTTDLMIGLPDFAYITSAARISGLPEHALIAKVALEQVLGITTIGIDGSAYAGKLDLQGSGSKMTITGGTLVCAGSADISGTTGGGRLVTAEDARLWAGRITVNSGSSVNLGGESRVLDDLELAGRGAKAVLTGSFYGFGDGRSDDGTESGVANRSSAILVNGLDSVLDISGLNRLMLAGRAYISDSLYAGHVTAGDYVGMPESVSVRSNQQMYLIDPVYLEGADQNPQIDNKPPDGFAGLTDEGEVLKNKYGFKLRHLTSPYGTQYITYYFMEFENPSEERTHRFFNDYFAEHSGQMNDYLEESSDLNTGGSGTPGYTVRGKDGVYTPGKPDGVDFGCTGMRETFNQLKKTLIDANTFTEKENPYEYIVNTDKVNGVNGVRRFISDQDGETVGDEKIVGIVTDGDYTIENPGDLRLIIAAGDVAVKDDFIGLVICGGTMRIEDSVTMEAKESDVVAAFSGVWTEDGEDTLASYLLNGAQAGADNPIAMNEDGWNLDQLVTCRNWVKN